MNLSGGEGESKQSTEPTIVVVLVDEHNQLNQSTIKH